MRTLLETTGLSAFYGDFQALYDIDVKVGENETVAIVGANCAGKSSLLKTLTGLIPSRGQAIMFDGIDIGKLPAHRLPSLGLAMVPEGRKLFASLSVEENLMTGAYRGRPGPWTLDRIYDLFPILRERRNSPGTALSGGQQQMVAIGRALMSNPRLLLCDEISLGLAPIVVGQIYDIIPTIRGEGTALVIVEQDVGRAMAVADRVYCLQEGRVSLEGDPRELTREQISNAYFGRDSEAA